MSTWNKSDLAQRTENIQRVRRDRLTSPGVNPAGFVEPSGDIHAIPGDQAPYARVPPFDTPFQAFGVPTTLKFEDPNTSSAFPNSWPILDVTNWRVITIGIRYYITVSGTPGQLRLTPFYGQAKGDDFKTDDLRPKLIYSDALTVNPDNKSAYHTVYQEEIRTGVITPNLIFPFVAYFSLDVAPYTAFTIDVDEISEAVTCDPENPELPCSIVELTYSLSM
jgi:hypothetical protein